MLEDITLLTKNDRKELQKLIKIANKDKFHKIKMNTDSAYYWNYYQRNLLTLNLISKCNYTDGLSFDKVGNPLGDPAIKITDDGYHYFEKYHEYIKSSILKSAITPIVVSVVTTLITIGVKQLLQLILK